MGFSKADFQAPAATLAAWQTTNFHFCTASPSAQLRATGAALSSLRGSAAETPSRAAAEGSSRHSPLSARYQPAVAPRLPPQGRADPAHPQLGARPAGRHLREISMRRGSRCPRRDGRRLLQNDRPLPHNPNPPNRGPACPLKGTGGGGRVMGRAQTTRAAVARRERLRWALISARAPAERWYGSRGPAFSSMRWQPAHDVLRRRKI